MSERAIRLFVPGFLLVYFLIGFSRWVTYQVEIFPIGAWGMFHRIDKVFNDYDLAILRKGDRVFDPAVLASDPDNPAGVERTGQARLLLNGWVRLTKAEEHDAAARYRDFIDRQIVGPDAEYEIVQILDRSRRSEYDKIRRGHFGPFETDPGLAPPEPGARFAFARTNRKFQKPKDRTERRTKRKKSAR